MKKTFSFLLALCLMLSLLPVGAYASQEQPAVQEGQGSISGSEDYVIDEGALPDGQEILDSYAQMLLYPQYSMTLFGLGPDGFQDQRQQYIYNELKDWIVKVAAGEAISHFVLEIPADPALSWSRSGELNNAGDDVLVKTVYETAKIDAVIDCLIADMPYELYWLGKSDESSVTTHISVKIEGDTISIDSLEMVFLVGESYRNPDSRKEVSWTSSSGVSGKTHYCYTVNAQKKIAAENAVKAAMAIRDEYQGLSDYEKLLAYKDRICRLTDYDYDAVSSSPSLYGDPWQIINVFDGDDSTNVVCEGYSKAFQYLCDLSTFNDAACYTAIGTIIGDGVPSGSAAHMWNIVRLEGKNYLVDVTNSDSENMGNQLFLAGAVGNPQDGYTVTVNGSNVKFEYDLLSDDMKNLMSQVLTLSDTSYDPNGSTEPEEPVHEHQWSTEWKYDDTHHWHDCTAADCPVSSNAEKDGYGEHQFGEWTTVKEATATEDGSRERQCACGCKQTEVISATGGQECQHEWKENKVISEASCEQEGQMEYICEKCQATELRAIPALGHDWGQWRDYSETEHKKDCMRDGCTAISTEPHSFDDSGKCQICGHVQQTGEHQHSYGQWVSQDAENHVRTCTAPDCGATETQAHSFDDSGKCQICGYVRQTEEHQHSYGQWVSQDAENHVRTCTTPDCGATETQAHNFDDSGVCSVCGYKKEQAQECQHEYGAWQYADADCHIRNCVKEGCSAVETQPHTWDNGVVTKEPTTTEKGIRTYTCTVCKGTKTEDIQMLEHQHSWSTDWTSNEQFHWHDCTAAGCTLTDNGQKNGFGAHTFDKGTVTKEATTTSAGTIEYKCTVCGRVKQEQIPILPSPQHEHKWNSAWTYDSTHHWHECTASGCTLSSNADKYGYAAHSFGAWRTVREATATTEGLMERQCGCGYKESKTIPVNTQSQCNHNWSGWTFNYPNYWERTCSICHARDIKITQVAVPKIISGANAVWRQGSSNGLSFTSDAPYSEFKAVMLNGFTLSNIYYSVSEGSTIVTLNKSCLDQLGVGTHKLSIVSAGGTAETTFTVKSKTIINNQTPTYNSNKPWTTPKTGDSANMGLWIGMIAVCVVGMGGVLWYVVKAKKHRRK